MGLEINLFVFFILAAVSSVFSQDKAMTFEEAAQQGVPHQQLDESYKSAVHSDPELAVFKSPEEQQRLQKAYASFLNDLGSFLKTNNFKWEKQVRCFNRIYFSPEGKVDYFLYNFPEGQLRKEQKKEFTNLIEKFVIDYKFPLTASEKFAQCSPVKYTD